VLDARWVVLAATAAAGQEERLRRFARVLRSLPAPPEGGPAAPRLSNGLAARAWSAGAWTYLRPAHATPHKALLETTPQAPPAAQVDDLGRGKVMLPRAAAGGGKQLVLELPPFGVAAIRVGARAVPVGPLTLHLQEGRDAQYKALEAMSDRLAHDHDAEVSEADRRARRLLFKAIHAYREGRYADFARLAAAH